MLKRTICLAVSLAAINGAAFADTVSVTNNNDSGTGSFRDAVDMANGNTNIDTISFDSSYYIELQGEVVYMGSQELSIHGNGSTLSGGSVVVDIDDWDGGLFASMSGANLMIEDLTFQKSFNNGLAVFLPEGSSADVSIWLDNVTVSQSQFFGVLVDGQSTTGFNTDDIIHFNCDDPWPYDFDANISVFVTDSEFVQNGRLAGGYDISLATGCPQDFDGLRVDQGGPGSLMASITDSSFDHNLADGAELDEKGDGFVDADVSGSTFNHNGATQEILCTDADQCGDDFNELIADLDDGFDIDEEDEGHMIADVIDTHVVGNNDEGLDFDEAGEGYIDVYVESVTAIGNEDEAFKASEEDGGDVMAEVWDSVFKQGGDDGTQIEEEDDGDITVMIMNSKITHNAKVGVKVEQPDAGVGTLYIENTDLRRNDEPFETDGIENISVN